MGKKKKEPPAPKVQVLGWSHSQYLTIDGTIVRFTIRTSDVVPDEMSFEVLTPEFEVTYSVPVFGQISADLAVNLLAKYQQAIES